MKIAVISDLHIKDSSFGNKFLLSDLEFSETLKNLSDKYDKVILNGDVIELWKTLFPFYSSQQREYDKIENEYKHTFKILRARKNIILIKGNHDNRLRKVSCLNVVDEIKITNSRGETFLFWHGHLDFFNSIVPYLGFFFTWLSGLFERIFARGTSDYKGLASIFKKPFFKNSTQIRNFKKRINKDDSLIFVSNGHTHYKELKYFVYCKKVRTYLNTGYYNKKQNIYIIDTESNSITGELW